VTKIGERTLRRKEAIVASAGVEHHET